MARKTSGRGRPKGTGVDDNARLESIAKLLNTNPEMRPTTAIKAIGVNDPSAIRRLRDKYALALPKPAAPARQSVALGARKDPKRTAPKQKTSKKKQVRLIPKTQQPTNPAAASASAEPSFADSLCDTLIQTACTTLELQFAAMMFAFDQSAFARLYQTQLRLGESTAVMLLKRPIFPWTQHEYVS